MIKEGALQEAEEVIEEEDVPDPDAFEVSIVDDTPEEDRGRVKQADDDAEDADVDDDDEEVDETQFSKRIQKRINKLRYDYNEERREKERFQRENTEAVTYAQSIQSQNDNLRNQSSELRRLLYDQVAAKTDTEIEAVKRRYKDAYESGDTDSVVSAQEDLSRLYAEKTRFAVESDGFDQQAASQQQPQPQQQAPNIPPPDPMAVDWLKRNSWFQQPGYEELTGFAVGLHEKLVKQGVDPRNNPSYYENIDAAIEEQFSKTLGKGKKPASEAPTSRRTPVVSPSKRGSGGTPRKVELTSTQVSLAKKLGLSPQQYAVQLMKEMSNG